MPSSVLNKPFRVAMLVKGVDGVLQIFGGALLYSLKPGTLHQAVALLTQRELTEDPRDWMAVHLLAAVQHLGDAKLFGAVYLCAHGLLKLLLAISLLRGALWAYPAMIGYLVLFIGYQLYRYSLSHAVGWLLLAGFDTCVVWLTWHEYRKFQSSDGQVPSGPR